MVGRPAWCHIVGEKKVSILSQVLIKIPINKVLLYVILEETVISILELSQMQKMENLCLHSIYHHGNLRLDIIWMVSHYAIEIGIR